MRYTPAELAEELGCSADTIYKSWLPAGMPHERDETGRIWIVGPKFRDWALASRQRKSAAMQPGEAYCLRCNKPVKMIGPLEIKPTNKYLELVSGRCAECGAAVNRARKKEHDQS